MRDIDLLLAQLADYALDKGLIDRADRTWAVNQLLNVLGLDRYDGPESGGPRPLQEILEGIVDWAVETGRIEDGPASRDLLDTALMGALTPRPSWVIRNFQARYECLPQVATDWYYRFSQDTDYIRRYRIEKDMKWVARTEYGELDITINLSKPEKDPKAIA